MVPAQQRLGTHHLVRLQIDNRLEQQLQFELFHGNVQVRFQAHEVCRLPRHVWRVADDLGCLEALRG